MNKKQREDIGRELEEIATANGADARTEHDSRSAMFVAGWPDVSVSVDIDDLFKGGMMAHFHGARRDLVMGPWFDSINTCHRHKATLYRPTRLEFMMAFRKTCEAIYTREVFV